MHNLEIMHLQQTIVSIFEALEGKPGNCLLSRHMINSKFSAVTARGKPKCGFVLLPSKYH